MAKQMSNSKRAKEKRNREQKVAFQEAISDGHTSRRDVSNAMGLKHFELSNFFEENPKCYKVYTQRRRELVDIAADNVQDIVEDPTHPKHYEASKYVLQNYQSDLDNILTPHDGEALVVASEGTGNGVVIKFQKIEKDGEEN